ncbi:hypothetical protein ACS0PU_002870 [Formica fusca]
MFTCLHLLCKMRIKFSLMWSLKRETFAIIVITTKRFSATKIISLFKCFGSAPKNGHLIYQSFLYYRREQKLEKNQFILSTKVYVSLFKNFTYCIIFFLFLET